MLRNQQEIPPHDKVSEEMSPALCGILAWHDSWHSSFQAETWASLPEGWDAFGRTRRRLVVSLWNPLLPRPQGLAAYSWEDAGYWNLWDYQEEDSSVLAQTGDKGWRWLWELVIWSPVCRVDSSSIMAASNKADSGLAVVGLAWRQAMFFARFPPCPSLFILPLDVCALAFLSQTEKAHYQAPPFLPLASFLFPSNQKIEDKS